MWKKPLLHACHEYSRELQPFCRVEGHERHVAVRLFRLVHIGDERDLREEVLEPVFPFLGTVLEVLCHTDELAQVLEAIVIVFLCVILEGCGIARLLDDVLDNLVKGACSQLSHICKYECSKILEFEFYLRRELWYCTNQLCICDQLKE